MLRKLFSRFVIWAFERFYHQGAWTYDTVAWLISRGFWERWAVAVLPDYADVPLLDLGCGTGFVQRARTKTSAFTVGLDESWPMLKLARRKVVQQGHQAILVRAVGQALPFKDHSWPIVLATFPAPYLFAPQTLQEIRRVLGTHGSLIIVDGGALPPGWYARLVAFIYAVVFGRSSTVSSPQPQSDPRIKRLQAYGFAVTTRWITVDQSQIQILEAVPNVE